MHSKIESTMPTSAHISPAQRLDRPGKESAEFKDYIHSHQRAVFATNKVTTTRFNIFNFLPITIALQFAKVINVFYLGNAILQSFPSVSTNDPLYTIVPLTILVLLGILKEGLADYKRHKIDKQTNAQPAMRLTGRRNGAGEASSPTKSPTKKNKIIAEEEINVTLYEVEKCKTEDLLVGDIIRVDDDQPVPADCFLLASEKSNNKEICQDG
jgi:phospholipid-translocating ATPase